MASQKFAINRSDNAQMPTAAGQGSNYAADSDNMFIDDLTFTNPSSMVGSPGGQSSNGIAHSPASDNHQPTSAHASAPAIPIKQQRDRAAMMNSSHGAAPSSAPQNHFNLNHGEFGYVQRRVRKTSVDERRVSFYFSRNPMTSSPHPLRPRAGVASRSSILLVISWTYMMSERN